MIGHAAHGDFLLLRDVLVPISGGKGQIQHLGSDAGILIEHFIKVPQPEKEQAIGALLFHL